MGRGLVVKLGWSLQSFVVASFLLFVDLLLLLRLLRFCRRRRGGGGRAAGRGSFLNKNNNSNLIQTTAFCFSKRSNAKRGKKDRPQEKGDYGIQPTQKRLKDSWAIRTGCDLNSFCLIFAPSPLTSPHKCLRHEHFTKRAFGVNDVSDWN